MKRVRVSTHLDSALGRELVEGPRRARDLRGLKGALRGEIICVLHRVLGELG